MSQASDEAGASALAETPAGIPVVVATGVSGSGKTTLGQALEAGHGFRFLDADDYHPPENVAKMRDGIPLDDVDRAPWLRRLADVLAKASTPTVLACSALKARYRDALASGCPQALFVHLAGSQELIGARMTSRASHYMPPSLLASQFDTLEALCEDEASITLECGRPVPELCAAVLDALAARLVAPWMSDLPTGSETL